MREERLAGGSCMVGRDMYLRLLDYLVVKSQQGKEGQGLKGHGYRVSGGKRSRGWVAGEAGREYDNSGRWKRMSLLLITLVLLFDQVGEFSSYLIYYYYSLFTYS